MRKRRVAIILGIALIVLLVGPYLIPLSYQGVDPATLADEDGDFVRLSDQQVYVVDRGPEGGEAVLLLHGFGGSTFSWRDNIDALAAAGYRAIAFDRPPYGLSEKRADADYSLPAYADLTAELMDMLGIARATLVGHSAGGSVAAYFATRHAERVDRLVLAAGAVFTGGGGPPGVGALLHFPPLARWTQVALHLLLTPERLAAILATAPADPGFVTPAVFEGYTQFLKLDNWDAALVNVLRSGGGGALDEAALAALNMPVLILWGEMDAWVPLENGERLHQLMPTATYITYQGVGHLLQEEASEAFNRDLLAFLESTAR